MIENFIKNKKAFIFGLDDVIYPQKDYLLQVYYLFSAFLSHTEQLDAVKILDFMKDEFEKRGTFQIFDKTAEHFKIAAKYKTNFELLHQTARLPLKLLLFKNVLEFMQRIIADKKQIYLLVDGNPLEQLNKMKQMEWHGVGSFLRVYFTTEFAPKPDTKCVEFILKENHLSKQDITLIGNDNIDEGYAAEIGVDYLPLTKLL